MPLQTIDLSGRVALVTGGSRGIGRAIATALGAAGADVAINCHHGVEHAAATADTIRSAGARAIVVPADVSLRQSVLEMVSRVETGLGSIDILVNNAGVAIFKDLDELDEAEFDRTIAVNLKSAFLCTQAVVAAMRSRRWGRVVNISSAAARGPGLVGVHYNAAKAGLEGLTRGYAARLAREGVTVNAVAPGPVDTDMSGPLKQAGVFGRIPVGRLGSAGEVAQAVLAAIANPFITGQTIAVNGGILFG